MPLQENDPSSSSMSGYDLKGMLSRARNQAGYVQNHVLEGQQTDDYNAQQQPHHQQQPSASDFSQPEIPLQVNGNDHQFLSQNTAFQENSRLTPGVLSHVVSHQNPVSARDQQKSGPVTQGEPAPSSYHPVVSQDFNPLKTTLGNHDDVGPDSSCIKSQEESKVKGNSFIQGDFNQPHMQPHQLQPQLSGSAS